MYKVIAFVFVLCLVSCKSFKEPECLGVAGFKVRSLNMKGIEADIALTIKNPNDIGFSIYPSQFEVELGGVNLGTAKLKRRVHIDAKAKKDYDFRLKSSFDNLNLMDITKLVTRGASGSIHVKGTLKAGKFYLKKRIPVDEKQSIR
ncbi:MAG: LEA type 2 family protein [Bacteroidia bacterium]